MSRLKLHQIVNFTDKKYHLIGLFAQYLFTITFVFVVLFVLSLSFPLSRSSLHNAVASQNIHKRHHVDTSTQLESRALV